MNLTAAAAIAFGIMAGVGVKIKICDFFFSFLVIFLGIFSVFFKSSFNDNPTIFTFKFIL